MGYHRAGFDVVGVDINPQPDYPFEFIQADWAEPLSYLPGLWEREGVPFAIHASPPCQAYSTMTKKWGREASHPDLVGPVQMALRELAEEGMPYVIENVPGAPLADPITLCGSMFSLESGDFQLRRHRNFESNLLIFPPGPCAHRGRALGVYGNPGGSSKRDGIKFAQIADWRIGMGIDWMSQKALAESIPPAYTEYIGRRVLSALSVSV